MGYALFVFMLGVSLLLLLFNGAAARGAAEGLRLFFESFLPCLFPFAVCGQYFMLAGKDFGKRKSGTGRRNGAVSRVLKGLFEASVCALCGIPTAAMICDESCRRGITPARASALCALMSTVNPVFITGLAAARLLKLPGTWPYLAAAHYIPALAGAVLLEAFGRGETEFNECAALSEKGGGSRAGLLASSISNAVTAMLRAGGAIVFFRVLAAAADSSGALGFLGETGGALAACAFEMTNGLELLAALGMDARLCASLFSFFMSFGGLCVFMQSALFFDKLKALPYFGAKLIAACASFLLCRLLLPEDLGGAAAAMAHGSELLGVTTEAMLSRGVTLLATGASFALAGAASFLYSVLFVRRRTV